MHKVEPCSCKQDTLPGVCLVLWYRQRPNVAKTACLSHRQADMIWWHVATSQHEARLPWNIWEWVLSFPILCHPKSDVSCFVDLSHALSISGHSGTMHVTRYIAWRVRNQTLHVQSKFSQKEGMYFFGSYNLYLESWGLSNLANTIQSIW